MSRVKKEILNKLKEYAGKMGRDHLGGDDIPSNKKRGGLRDFDGYDNVQYNKDMPMDEMQVVNKKTGKDITKHLLDYMEGKIDKKKFEKLTGLKKESVKEAQQVNLKSVDVLRRAVQKINKKYKVQVSKHPVTKGQVEIELGDGNHPDRDYRAIDNLVKKIGIKNYSVFNEGKSAPYGSGYKKAPLLPTTTDHAEVSEASIKGKNNKTGESFGMVIGSDKKNREGDFEVTIRKTYSSRISSYKFMFDKSGNLIAIKDYGYSMDGKFPDMKGGGSVKSVKPNPRETITQIAKVTSPAFAKKIYQHVKKVNESVKEATFRPNSGTMSGGTYGLDNRKYQLKRDVKGVRIGDYTNVILPKGTIIYNIPGGVFAHHDVLAAYQSGQNKYFNKPTFKGISIRREKSTILSIEKNSKILESVNEAYVVLHSPKKGVKPVATAAYRDKKDAEKWAKDLGGITMIVKKKMKGVDESVNESMFSAIDQIRQDSKDVRDFVKKVFKDREFKKMSNDKEFIKYLKSIYEGINEAIPQNFHQGRTSDYHTALRGKNKDYSGGTNFKKKNHGQPDVEEDDEDQETNHLSNKQLHVKAKLKVAESGKKKSEKNYKDWKSSRLRKEIARKIKALKNTNENTPNSSKPYILDDESILKGTPEDKDAIDRDIDESLKDMVGDAYTFVIGNGDEKKITPNTKEYVIEKIAETIKHNLYDWDFSLNGIDGSQAKEYSKIFDNDVLKPLLRNIDKTLKTYFKIDSKNKKISWKLSFRDNDKIIDAFFKKNKKISSDIRDSYFSQNEAVINEKQFKGLDGIDDKTPLTKISDTQKLKIIQSTGNIISFKVPKGSDRNFWQVISKGKIKKQKDLSNNVVYILPGKMIGSPKFKSIKDLIKGVDWVSVEKARRFNESVSEVAERDYKDEYKKFQSSTKSKKYRAELNKYNRDKGTYGNGDGKDASHKGGKIVGFESEKKNRGRAEKSRLKKK